MKIDEHKFEKAMDTAMMIASAKLFLFNRLWSELKGKLESKKEKPQRVEMIRRYLLNCVADLDEKHLFVPLEKMASQTEVQKYLEKKYGSKQELEKISKQLTDCMTRKDPTLVDLATE